MPGAHPKPRERRVPLLTKAARRPGRLRTLAGRIDIARSIGPRALGPLIAERRGSPQRAAAARNRLYAWIWSEAAAAVGAAVVTLSDEVLELRRDDASTLVWRQITQFDDAVSLHLSLDKAAIHERLRGAGVALPAYARFHSAARAPAEAFLAAAPAGAEFAVKPAGGTGGGIGVTTGIRDRADLARAILRGSRFAEDLLIELQAPGDVVRVLVLDGEVLDVVLQSPPRVVGDGESTLAELIGAENRRRVEGDPRRSPLPIQVDLDCVLHLRNSGRSLGEVPAAGEGVEVKNATNENGTADRRRIVLSPALEDLALRAAEAARLRLAGVDLIAVDPGLDLDATVLEVNGGPGLHHHYLVADPEPARVAEPILEALLSPLPAVSSRPPARRG